MERQLFSITDSFAVPVAAPSFQDQSLYRDQVTREVSAEYVTILPAHAKLITGYNLQRDDNLFDNAQTITAGAGAQQLPDPNFTNLFAMARPSTPSTVPMRGPLGLGPCWQACGWSRPAFRPIR
jgi:hypothetical protein